MMRASSRNSQKENVRVKSLHVTWSQQYQKYPSGSPKPQPLKSILKDRANQSVSMTSQDFQAEPPIINAEPMQTANYLKSPIETLLESIEIDSSDHISQHDLLEAYNTLQTRIRSQIQVICQSDRELLAWNAVKTYSSQVVQVLRRDIRRALSGPSSPQKSSSLGGSILSNNLEFIAADEIKTATDLSLVCHQSLRFLSDLFRFPALYSIFSTNNLHVLLDDLLTISLTKSLPTHNSRKTHALIIWIIQIQRLPAAVLAPKKREISSALKRAVAGDFDQDGKLNVVSDGLEAICDFLQHHPSLFLPPLSELLPSILPRLLSSSFDIRLHAARALNGFVLAKINTQLSISGDINDSISRHIRSFIDTQSSKRISAGSDVRLPTLIAAALAVNNPSHSGNGPGWALTVLASLIVLSDYALFSHPRSLKLYFSALAQAQTHKSNSVRCLLPHVWKCFIWAFLRISTVREGAQDETTGISLVGPSVDLEERAFLVVKQELRGGIGVAFVASLLGPTEAIDPSASNPGGHRITQALAVVRDMVASDSTSTQSEGLSLLTRLANAIGSSQTSDSKDDAWNCDNVLALSIFDGTISTPRRDQFSAAVHAIHNFRIGEVRHLSEPEIAEHWDALISIWIKCTERYLEDTTQLATNLVRIWQSLLLVQAQLTQGNCHLTTPQAFTKRVASIVSEVFLPASQTSNGVGRQARQLSLVAQLWTVIKNVFAAAWLPVPAEYIFRALLNRSFDLSDPNVKGEWCNVCSDLVSAGIPVLLELLSVHNERDAEVEVKRQLWSVLAKILQSSEVNLAWQDAVSFLDVSLGAWTMSDSEFELWKDMLRCAVFSAGSANVRPTTVIEHIVERLERNRVKWPSPKVTLELFSYVSLRDNDTAPSHCFALVDSVLDDLYARPDLLSSALLLLRLLRDVMTLAPPSLIVTTLVALRRCLCRWIEDRSEVLADEEYNDVIMPLYCDALSILQHDVPSVEVLQALTPFFTAGFVHIPPPILGPLAFGTFWRATYHGLEQFYPVYTGSLKDCLKCLAELDGQGELREGLSLDPDSQLTSSSIAPDSQLPNGLAANTYDQSRYPDLNEDTVDATRRHANDTVISNESLVLSHPNFQHPPAQIHSANPETPLAHSIALAQLREYSSHWDDSLSAIPFNDPPDGSQLLSRSSRNSSDAPGARGGGQFSALPPRLAPAFSPRSKVFKAHSDVKRTADVSARPTKRRKTDPGLLSSEGSAKEVLANVAKESASLQGQGGAILSHHQRQSGKKSGSEPITRTSPAQYIQPTSQPNPFRQRMLLDCVELPTYRQVLNRQREHRSQKSQAVVLRSASRSSSHRPGTPALLYDYDSWETPLSTSALRHVQRERVQVASRADTAESLYGGRSGGSDLIADTSHVPDSPSFRLIPKHKRGRSRTAPVSFRPSQTMPSRSRRSKTAFVKLDALEQAYAIVANETSPIPVEGLFQTRLTRQIGTALAEQMGRTLGDLF